MTVPHLAGWQWALVALGAFLSGASKTGIPGIGIVSVALFALVWPTKESVGIVLLILIAADCVAIGSYPRRHARWDHLRRLFPWAAVGVGAGAFAMGRISDNDAKRLIGCVLLFLVALQIAQRVRAKKTAATGGEAPPAPASLAQPLWLVPLTGFVAGFTTMIANAAGPVMILYLLTLGLDKVTFVGTAAWFFFAVNLFKVPFNLRLGLINARSAVCAALLLPAAVAGGLAGRHVLRRLDQRVFEWSALVLTLLAGLKLALTGLLPF
jgi:uncharacterized membrane protein YfcA